jgi:hypothetical protein
MLYVPIIELLVAPTHLKQVEMHETTDRQRKKNVRTKCSTKSPDLKRHN